MDKTLEFKGFEGHIILYCKDHYFVKDVSLIDGLQRIWALRCGYGLDSINNNSLEYIANNLFTIISKTKNFDVLHFNQKLHKEISKSLMFDNDKLTPIEKIIHFYASEISFLQVFDSVNNETLIKLPKPKKRLFTNILKGEWNYKDYLLVDN